MAARRVARVFRNISRFYSDITKTVLFHFEDEFSYFMPVWGAERGTCIFTASMIAHVQPNGSTLILDQLKSFGHFCNKRLNYLFVVAK